MTDSLLALRSSFNLLVTKSFREQICGCLLSTTRSIQRPGGIATERGSGKSSLARAYPNGTRDLSQHPSKSHSPTLSCHPTQRAPI
eukprot:2329281-Pyramimonas_sp.AAC.1